MMETGQNQPPPHEAELLLPWYLNGTLQCDEAREVERHIGGCPSCRVEAAELRKLKGEVRSAVEARPAPPPELFQRMLAQVKIYEAERRGAAGLQARGWEGIAQRLFDLLPSRLAPSIAVGLIVIQFTALGVMGAILYRTVGQRQYETLTGPEVQNETERSAGRLKVAFAEKATEREIRSLLQKVQARIVDGPSPEGFYEIQMATRAEAEKAVREMREKDLPVRFVESMQR